MIQERYKKIIPELKEKFGYKNNLAVPRILKVVVNIGVGRIMKDEKILAQVEKDLAAITGQKISDRKAKKAIASFKTREGMVVGKSVVLRKKKMYDFLNKLINITFPRTRDFRGIDEKNIDQGGNLSIGIKEQIVFPEISPEAVNSIFGFEVTIVTNAKNYQEGLELFKLLRFPFKK